MLNLESRVEHLEKSAMRWRRVATLAVGALLVLLCMGQTKPAAQVQEARTIIFRDGDGRVRMVLGQDVEAASRNALGLKGDGLGASRLGLSFIDDDGEVTSRFVAVKNDASLVVGESMHERAESFKQFVEANPNTPKETLALLEAAAHAPAFVLVRGKGIDLGGPSGQRTGMAMSEISANTAVFGDSLTSKDSVRIDGGRITIFDPEGRERALLGPTQTKNPATGAVTSFPSSTLTLYSEDGTVLRQIP